MIASIVEIKIIIGINLYKKLPNLWRKLLTYRKNNLWITLWLTDLILL